MTKPFSSRVRQSAVLLIAAGLMAGSFPCSANAQSPTASHPKPQHKPNIIFILADDLGYGDVGCFGQKKIETPSLDRMADEGMRFTSAYAGSTVCAAVREVNGRDPAPTNAHALVGDAGRRQNEVLLRFCANR